MRTEERQAAPSETQIAELMREIERYLDAVDVFRAAGADPSFTDDEELPEWWVDEHLLRRVEPRPASPPLDSCYVFTDARARA